MMKRLALCWWLLCAVHAPAAAHVLDQYLQVTQIAFAPDGVRVELRLIPGVEVADRVFAMLDADGDGQLSAAEERQYALRVRQDIALTINDQPAPLTLADTSFPAHAAIREGVGAIRLTFNAAVAWREADNQRLQFRNDHLPEMSGYLVNALVPESDVVAITRQERDVAQRGLLLHFHARLAAAHGGLHRVAWVFALALALALCLPVWRWLRLLRAAPANVIVMPQDVRVPQKHAQAPARCASRRRSISSNKSSSVGSSRKTPKSGHSSAKVV